MKRLLLFTALLAMTASVSFGQTRRVLVEEFTGSWCGWCPRGALALEQADKHYPGRAIGVAVHNADPMSFAQADSLTGGAIGFPAMARLSGFPSGWVLRRPVSNTWISDPMDWVDSLNWSTGLVDQAMLETPKASISMSNITFDPTTGMVSVDLKSRFVQSMSGDFRFNVLVTEDSVSGAQGTTWDQHNYYYKNTNYPQSPFFNRGAGAAGNGLIANFVYNHVYRGSMAGIMGAKGIIPSSVAPGQEYTTTFHFRLPFSVMNPNHVHLVGIVHQYSATDGAKGEVFDAEQQPLSTTPIQITTADYTFNPQAGYNPQTNATYVTALSNGDSSQIISFFNSSTTDATLSIAVDQSGLPEGWTYKVNPSTVTIPASGSASTTLTITAPSNSNFVGANLLVTPVKQGAWGQTAVFPVYSLASNTKDVIMYYGNPEVATLSAIPTNIVPTTAVMPLNDDVISNYPITDMDLAVISTPVIDNTSGQLNIANALPVIETMLSNGKKVMLTTDLGLYYALDPNASAYQSQDGTAFFQDTLGLTYRALVQHVANNAYTSFKVTATNDPIGKGLTTTANSTGTREYEQYTSSFDVDNAKSTPLFYFDNAAANNAGIRYENPQGGKLVYLGFKLNALANQTNANKIASNAIDWLMAPPQAVAQPKMTNEGMFATSNPFVGRTEIRYTPKADESNVTFSAYDVLGHEVATMTSKMVSGAYTATFDASTLASGTYTIVAHTSTGAHQIRVVAE